MARPWRRVLIGLSIRLGISVRELERYDIATVRQYLAMLDEINNPARKPATDPKSMAQQSPEQMMSAVGAALGHLKG